MAIESNTADGAKKVRRASASLLTTHPQCRFTIQKEVAYAREADQPRTRTRPDRDGDSAVMQANKVRRSKRKSVGYSLYAGPGSSPMKTNAVIPSNQRRKHGSGVHSGLRTDEFLTGVCKVVNTLVNRSVQAPCGNVSASSEITGPYSH